MIFVKLTSQNEIDFVHYMPFHSEHGLKKTQEELQTEGKIIDALPTIEENGKIPILKYDAGADKFYYEYTERPLTPEEEIKNLKTENTNLKSAQAQILLKLMRNNIK